MSLCRAAASLIVSLHASAERATFRDEPMLQLAEHYGVPEAAAAAYAKVTKPESPRGTAYELAQRRLKALGAKK